MFRAFTGTWKSLLSKVAADNLWTTSDALHDVMAVVDNAANSCSAGLVEPTARSVGIAKRPQALLSTTHRSPGHKGATVFKFSVF